MNEFQEFVWAAYDLTQQYLPTYSSKYSRQDFTQPQLVTLNLIRIKCDWTYRQTYNHVQLMTPIREHLNLEVMPHYTTIQKAFDRMTTSIGRLLLDETLDAFELSGFSGLDATGFGRSRASQYYTQRTSMTLNAVKTTILMDVKAQAILDCHLTTTRKHDTQIGPDLLKKHPNLSVLVADKGYEDKSFRDWLRDQSIRPLIPHREHKPVDYAANARMKDDDYNQRQIVESGFSVIKRKYGDRIRARKWYRQFREMVFRMVVYNLDRIIKDQFFLKTILLFQIRR